MKTLVSRRTFFHLAGAAGLIASPALIGCAERLAVPALKRDPFSLGVAAGEPSADGFVLWTRLAPDPLSQDPATPGGMTGGPVQVAYEIATDPQMRQIARKGTATAEPGFAWSVHAEIAGLQPGRPYWYRFLLGDAASRVGRVATTPAAGAALDRLKFGFVSCANYELGYFSAYRHLADENPDLVVFLGDYIYEDAKQRRGAIREHSDGATASTLSGYRNRYAQYRLDPDLQRLHAEVPALMTWDDHEVQNDYAGQWSQSFDEPAKFLERRAAAYRAYYEHMPLRPSRALPQGPNLRLHERFRFGDLAEFSVLDGRQYRSKEACYSRPNKGGGHIETADSCADLQDPTRSVLGPQQEAWLYDGFSRATARWNVIAQDQLVAELKERQKDGTIGYWTEDWNGYPPSRKRLLTEIRDRKLANPVVIGGDIHSFWTNDLKVDFDDPKSPIVATEFVCTSITSHGPPHDTFAAWLPDNPHVKFFESRKRGYSLVDLTRNRMTTHYRAVSEVTDPQATVSTLKSFVVESGKPGAQSA